MSVPQRATVRVAIATALTSALTAAQAVYDHATTDFQGQSPVVRVLSAGSLPEQSTFDGSASVSFLFSVETWVLFSTKNQAGYGEKEAEAALDAVDGQLRDWLDGSANSGKRYVEYEGPSRVSVATLGGLTYLVEAVLLKCEEII